MINQMWFQAKETGEFDIGCAQHCGTNHYKMKGDAHRAVRRRTTRSGPREASANGARAYDADDKDAHWGWDWQRTR